MKMHFSHLVFAGLFLLAFVGGTLLTTAPARAQATDMPAVYAQFLSADSAPMSVQKWDQREELPGLVSTKDLLLMGAVTAGAVATYLVLRSSKRKKKERDAHMAADTTAFLSVVSPAPKSLQDRLLDAWQQSPVDVYVGLGRADKSLVMGVAVKF